MGSARRRRLTILLVGVALCSLLVGVFGGIGVQPVDAQSAPESAVADIESESFEADRTVFIITVRENGSAEWRFRYEQRLETDAETEDFRTYADRFNSEETESFTNFRDRAISLTESGSETTGREMSAERFNRSARIEERPPAGDEFAVIEMSFEWTGFGVVESEEVVVGDVFTGGLYVGPEQHLRFERGANLQFDSAEPEPDSTAAETLAESETVTWVGERSFADRQPRVTLIERGSDTTNGSETNSTTDSDPDSTNGSSQDSASDSEPQDPEESANTMPPMFSLAVIGFVIVLAGIAAAYRTGRLPTDRFDVDGLRLDGLIPGRTSDTETPQEPSSEAEAAQDASIENGEANAAASSAITDEQFLSDEERVVALLESQGGRMKQVDIVDQTDWSKSKVSMLLSEMDSEGTISKLRVGRENIVSLAGHEPEAVGSPFDDE